MAELFRYAAFISYSSKDAGFAKRLHGALESYRIPRSLGEFDLIGGGKKNRVYPVFRDREELSAGDLGERVEAALKASAALIVVCSPNSAASPWVQKEIGYFAGLGRRNRIFAIIADSAPLTDEAGADATPLCFPPAFRGDALQGADALEPLAADARKGKDGFRNAWLKLVAGIADVNAGALADRDRQRQRLQRVQAICAASAAIVTAGLAFAFIEERAARIDMSVQASILTSQGHSMQAIPFALAGLPSQGDVFAMNIGQGEAALMRSGAGVHITADLGVVGDTYGIALSGDGAFVATIAPNHEGTLTNLHSGARKPLGQLTELSPLSFAPDGAHLLAIARDSRGYLHNLRSGTRTELGSLSFSYTFSPDGAFLAAQRDRVLNSFERDDSGVLFNVRNGSITPLGPVSGLSNFQFSPDSAHFVYQRQNDSGVLLDLRSGRSLELGPIAGANDCRFSPDGAFLYVERDGAPAALYDLRSHSVRNLAIARNGEFSVDSMWLYVVERSFGGALHNLRSGEVFHLGETYGSHFSPRGTFFLSSHPTGLSLRNLRNGVITQLGQGASSAEFAGEETHVIVAWTGENPRRELIELRSGRKTQLGFYDSILFSGDVVFVIAPTQDGARILRSTASGKITALGRLRANNPFVRSGDWMATISDDGFGTLRNLKDGRSMALGSFSNDYDDYVFSEDAAVLAMRGEGGEGTVRDLRAPFPRSRGAALRAEICTASGDAIRPFAPSVRSRNDDLARRTRGRPWHPCDWRGLLAFENGWEGMRQWQRLIGVRFFGRRDYACGEINAGGETAQHRLDACRIPESLEAASPAEP